MSEENKVLVSVIIPNWNGKHWLETCLPAVYDQSYRNIEIWVIDNGSEDGSTDWLKEVYPKVHLIELERNFGFATAVNKGIEAAAGELLWLLNSDTRAHHDCLEKLVDTLATSAASVGAVAPLMLMMDNPEMVDDAGNDFSWYGEARKIGHDTKLRDFEPADDPLCVSGGCSLYRRSFFEKIGTFDESFFAYLEDIDLGLRGRLFGFTYALSTKTFVLHKAHGSEIDYKRYISLTTCNRLMIFFKNFTFPEILRRVFRISYGQVYYLLAHGYPVSSINGYLRFFKLVPLIWQKRKEIWDSGNDRHNNIKLRLTKPGDSLWFHFRKIMIK